MILRDYKNEDFKSLEKVIQKTWHYDELCSPKTARKLARVFLSSCLTNYTYSKVAVIDGNVVGIILANDKKEHKCPLSKRMKQIFYLLSLYCSKEGRSVMKIFSSVSGIDQVLLKETNKKYNAELSLFAIDENYRGHGIGKKLFGSAVDYFKKQNVDEFYLFTDTSCNYGFYEHQGMKRRCEQEKEFDIANYNAKMNFFIYDYCLN